MYAYNTIASDNDCIHLCKTNINEEDIIYVSFYKPIDDYRQTDSELLTVWDNSTYIYDTVFRPIMDDGVLSSDILQKIELSGVSLDEFKIGPISSDCIVVVAFIFII